MKNVFTLLFVSLLMTHGFAQSPKMIMVEEGTQASCPPCFFQNPPFDALLDANASKVVVLKYQVSWPGFDQMNLDNPTEVADRVAYYGFGGVPSGLVNGVEIANDCAAYPGAPMCLDQADVDAASLGTSDFDLDISAEFNNGILEISGSLTATAAVTGDLKLRIALTEQTVSSIDAPGGNNGETEFRHVFKKFIPGSAGITLSNSWNVGDTYTINETFNASTLTIYQFAELEVVAFVQNDDNKEILQAAKDQSVPITLSFENNATAVSATVADAVCSGVQSIAPEILIQNGGNATLTSADIVYSVNGGADETFNWTGSVATLGTEEITLPAYAFTATTSNTLTVSIQNPNGVTDENNVDNSVDTVIELAEQGAGQVTMVLNTDCWPEENSWELRDDSGAVVQSGGPYDPSQAESTITETLNVPSSGCFEFVFMDFFGDGLNGSQWNGCAVDGNITITAGQSVIYSYDGSYSTSEDAGLFEYLLVAVEDIESVEAWNIFPNPAQDLVRLEFTLTEQLPLQIALYNTLGKKVQTIANENFATGAHSLSADVSQLPNGMYYINVVSGEQTTTHKFIVSK